MLLTLGMNDQTINIQNKKTKDSVCKQTRYFHLRSKIKCLRQPGKKLGEIKYDTYFIN